MHITNQYMNRTNYNASNWPELEKLFKKVFYETQKRIHLLLLESLKDICLHREFECAISSITVIVFRGGV